ncbi:C40 family peptidase [Streptomyces violaceus]|uniref:C40 family peptidase n=1 Tax=Streptomyces violaceus TaxID=1936 RepID=UPI003807DCF9
MAFDVIDVIKAAMGKVGRPYVWGATGPNSFDCSGLMVWAYKQQGVNLPRTSQSMASFGQPVSAKNIKPGDLVTSNWGSGPSSHVGMYVGNGKILHAPGTGKTVRVANLDASYRSKVNAIRRVPGGKYTGVTGADFDLPDIPGLGDLGDLGKGLGDGLMAPMNLISQQLVNIAKGMLSVGQFAEFLLKLALPSTWVRIACGLMGSATLFLGLFFLVREARGAS